jgi:hypothetical protein
MSSDTARKYGKDVKVEIVEVPVKDLVVDPAVQRSFLNLNKIEKMMKDWNPLAVGLGLTSQRPDRSEVVLDGMHRKETIARLTDNEGTFKVERYTGLTREQEAQLFLDRNAGDKPNTIDRYKVGLVAGIERIVEIDKLVHSYGWTVSNFGGTGNLSCVVALQNLWDYSVKSEQQPNLVQMALMVITRAWGTEAAAGQGHIITGVGRLVGEYGDQLNVDILITRMREYPGGPLALTATARQYASMRKQALAMAVAELLVETYNKGLGPKTALRKWNKRR